MRYRGLVFVLLFAGVGLAGYFAAWSLGIWNAPGQAQVRPVPPGHQEIAWIAPATSGDAWERLVAALKLLQQDWPKLQSGALELDLDRAFLDLTAEVPEIGLRLGPGDAGKLWVRWYKLSGDTDSRQWIVNLRQRGTPPLAVVGGDTSDRALALAKALADAHKHWPGPAPLLLITTATADRYFPKERDTITAHEDWPKLMGVYAGRSFRFAFTNQRMVQAVLDFVKKTPPVWPQKNLNPRVLAGVVGPANPWSSLGLLGATGHLQPYFLYAMEWGDDGYSKDLAEIFFTEFAEQTQNYVGNVHERSVPYSVGDQFQANPREDIAISFFLNSRADLREQQQLLVLPTGAQRMRRFLRTLCRQAPMDMRNVVVVNGDAISFNTIYRDRDVAWNILDVPVPLVFFSHRSPVDKAAGFDPQKAATGTQDLLLYRDIFEALLQSSFDPQRRPVDADRLQSGLKRLRWDQQRVRLPATDAPANGLPFFDADGDRTPGTGEHVVWLRPAFEGQRNLPRATISVWHVAGAEWELSCAPLEVFYNRPNLPGE